MRRQKHIKWMIMPAIVFFILVMGGVLRESGVAEIKYPTRPIQLIVAYQPGASDLAYKAYTEKLSEYLGQPIAFVYKPGGSGVAGASFAAKAKPDGYTILGTSAGAIMLNPLTKEGLDFTLDDFAPIARLAKTPIVIAVRPNSPWKTLKDIVEEAKKFPGKITYSHGGVFTVGQLACEMFLHDAGIKMTHVPCLGATPAVTSLLAGDVYMTSSTMQPILHHFKSGALRPIAIFEKKRLKELPDVPTVIESGYSVGISVWYGFVAPKKTPEEVIKTLSANLKKVTVDHKDYVEDQLGKLTMTVDYLNHEEFANELKVENEAMKKIIKDLMKPVK